MAKTSQTGSLVPKKIVVATKQKAHKDTFSIRTLIGLFSAQCFFCFVFLPELEKNYGYDSKLVSAFKIGSFFAVYPLYWISKNFVNK